MRSARQPSRRAAKAEDQDVEVDVAASFKRQRAARHRAADHSPIEVEIDSFLGIVPLVVKENLGQLDLAAKELLGQIRTVVRPVVVAADDSDFAVKALLAKGERGVIAGAASAYDHHPFRGHRSNLRMTKGKSRSRCSVEAGEEVGGRAFASPAAR